MSTFTNVHEARRLYEKMALTEEELRQGQIDAATARLSSDGTVTDEWPMEGCSTPARIVRYRNTSDWRLAVNPAVDTTTCRVGFYINLPSEVAMPGRHTSVNEATGDTWPVAFARALRQARRILNIYYSPPRLRRTP